MTTRNALMRFLLIILIASIVIMGVTFLLNYCVHTVRMQELYVALQQFNREASRIDHLSMLFHFFLYKNFYEDKLTEQDIYGEELKMAGLFAAFEAAEEKPRTQLLEVITALFRKFYRPMQISPALQNAFILERKKDYVQALSAFTALQTGESFAANPDILLHRGFCSALSGDYREAGKMFTFVIDNYAYKEAALVAADLLKYITDLQNKADIIKQSRAVNTDKAERLYKLGAFKEALALLDEVQDSKVDYLKARLYEETGAQDKAAGMYREFLNNNSATQLAHMAGNRLAVMAALQAQ